MEIVSYFYVYRLQNKGKIINKMTKLATMSACKQNCFGTGQDSTLLMLPIAIGTCRYAGTDNLLKKLTTIQNDPET